MTFTVNVRFPTGQFNASSGGEAEWPPHPARVLSAGVAGAYRTGDPAVIAEMRRVYALGALPTIHAAKASPRLERIRRWVPISGAYPERKKNVAAGSVFNTFEAKAEGGRPEKKDEKAPEPGVWVGDGQVALVFTGVDADRELLTRAFAQVAYLGRPTSPAVLTVTDQFNAPDEYLTWVPDPSGDLLFGVADGADLHRLDARHANAVTKARAGVTAHPDTTSPRSVATYRQEDKADTADRVSAAPWEVVAAVSNDLTYLTVDSAFDYDTDSLTATIAATTGAAAVTPVFDGPHVPGVLVTGIHHDPVTVAIASGVQVLAPGKMSKAARAQLRAMCSTARTWTTLAPVPVTNDPTHELLTYGALELAARHSQPLGPGDCQGSAHRMHITARFTEPIAGPVIAAGVFWVPVEPKEAPLD